MVTRKLRARIESVSEVRHEGEKQNESENEEKVSYC
jgi:hypothetical protein